MTGGQILAKIFEEAGLPAGVPNVIVGSESEIGDDFAAPSIPSLISFTGSTPAGQNVGRIASSGEYLKHVALELGGNSTLVVLADVDLDAAVDAAVLGIFLHQGQICMGVNRIVVETPVYDEFVRRYATAAAALPVGDPADPATQCFGECDPVRCGGDGALVGGQGDFQAPADGCAIDEREGRYRHTREYTEYIVAQSANVAGRVRICQIPHGRQVRAGEKNFCPTR